MARKTKAELAAEREEEVAMRQAHEFAAYPSRLLAMMERATAFPNYYTLTVRDSMFVLQRERDEYVLPPAHTPEAQDDMDDLNMSLEFREQAAYEAAQVAKAKAVALAKLTKEERELLNL